MSSDDQIRNSTIVNAKTQQEYDKLMVYLEKHGYSWSPWGLPPSKNYWQGIDSCIRIPPADFGKTLNFDRMDFYRRRGCKIIDVDDYMRPNLNLKLIRAIRNCSG